MALNALLPQHLARLHRVFVAFSRPQPAPAGSAGALAPAPGGGAAGSVAGGSSGGAPLADGLGVPELRGVMTALGLPATDAELHAAIARCDVAGRGFLDERELGVFLASELGDESRTAELAAVFALQDPDGDGFLDAWNVAGVMTTLHAGTAAAAEVPLSRADLDAVLEEAGGGDARGMTMEAYMRLMGAAS